MQYFLSSHGQQSIAVHILPILPIVVDLWLSGIMNIRSFNLKNWHSIPSVFMQQNEDFGFT